MSLKDELQPKSAAADDAASAPPTVQLLTF